MSCVGRNSCYKAAYNGFIGYINHGCGGVKSCLRAARDGSIGGISCACNNIQACEGLADGDNGYASVNSAVVSCCNDDSECTGEIVNASGLPDQCGTSSPTSSPTTEIRILSINCCWVHLPLHHPPPRYVYFLMLYIICFTSNLSISNHHTYLFIFRP